MVVRRPVADESAAESAGCTNPVRPDCCRLVEPFPRVDILPAWRRPAGDRWQVGCGPTPSFPQSSLNVTCHHASSDERSPVPFRNRKATAPYGSLWDIGNSYCRSECTVIAAVLGNSYCRSRSPFKSGDIWYLDGPLLIPPRYTRTSRPCLISLPIAVRTVRSQI